MDITDTQSGEVDGAGADLTSDDGKKKKDIRRVQVYDCRPGSSNELPRKFNITDEDYNGFQCALRKEFSVPPDETFIVSTTDREEITEDIYKLLLDGKTLQLLESVHQMLPTATQERIEYQPHYHTLVQCGMYEYYASEGQEALPYAFAELIDNALSATRNNIGIRRIEIRLLFDESQGGPAIVVMDNGCGMTSKQLKNWAVYRLSKFIRDNTAFTSEHSQEPGYVRPNPVPRSLNSDISYFGVGGKQAVFYIGQSVRMISKPASSPDVHEFIMSKEEFERKERDREDIYSGFIRNRMPGDSSHVNSSEELFLVPIVNEEVGKDSFTAVVITRLQQAHITYLKQHFTLWTRELAHTYHYYIHGINGNSLREMRVNDSSNNIDIQICLFEKPNRIPRLINLRDVNNDMQTLYIRSSVSTFEFKATGPKDLLVEGLVRYHPFLYDQETYPLDPYSASTEKEDDDCMVVNPEGRGKRPIFECYWNGRLIPYTTVSEFKWCEKPKKTDVVPWECYNRISGVLFANDRFEVSTNKLTFMDLELQLREKATIFTRVNNGQEQRVNIEKEFTSWLEECHVQFDKQVMFLGFLGEMRRADMVKRLQFPWARFKAIKWDGKTYSKGQFVKSIKTNPIWFGSIVQFLLYGEHEGDVYATGGYVQIALEPKELYNDEKIIPISKIDRLATTEAIKENIKLDSEKLPDQLRVSWPDGNAWIENSIHPAGTPLGPIKVEILNKRGDVISRLANSKKLLIELEVIWHSPEGNVQINSHTGVHSTKWEYWFKSMRNLSKLGKYSLNLQTRPADCSASEWEKMPDKRLPSYTLNFSIKECDAVSFAIDAVLSPVHVGVPFDLQLHFRDRFNHPTQPPNGFKPQLKSSSLQLSYEKVTFEKNTVIKNVKALVKATHWNKMHTVSVHIPGLKPSNQSLQLNLQPGPPHTLFVLPAEDLITIENKTPVNFKVEVHDECQNVTKNQNLIINCELLGAPGLPLEVVDCSNSGSGLFLSKPLCLKGVSSEQILTAKFSIENNETVSCVERRLRVLPSSQVSRLEIYRQEVDSDDVMVLQNCERIDWTAGDTLGNLHFRLFDEGGKLIPLQEKLTSNIQLTWTVVKGAADLADGKLPSICVPTQAGREHYYTVTLQDQTSIGASFIIVPRPDEPERLRVKLSERSITMGETLADQIFVDLSDQYGNKALCLNSQTVKMLSVSAEGLDKTSLKTEWQDSTKHLCVSGVRFAGGSPGRREMCFQYKQMKELVDIEVMPGPPSQLKFVVKPEMPIQVKNGHGLEMPLIFQLCDHWGNPSPDQRVIIEMKSGDLKIKSSVSSQPVDSEAKASFKLQSISGQMGEHELRFVGSFSKKAIPGPVVRLNLIPDPNKPVELRVRYDTAATLCAGDIFPDFSVVVISEEGLPAQNVSPENISMQLWKDTQSGPYPPSTAISLNCNTQKNSEDCFCFRDKQIPELAGKYLVQFLLVHNKVSHLLSEQISLNIVPSKPVKLGPETPPLTPVVSNSNVRANRILLQTLSLKVMDQFNNAVHGALDGRVIVSITSTASDAALLPVFEKKEPSLTFSITNGESKITDVVLLENSPGMDGADYFLNFNPEFEQEGLSITPYSLPFRFCNDAEHQEVIERLSKKKDLLSQSILMFREIFDMSALLLSELKGQVRDANHKLNELKPELRKNGLEVSKLTTLSEIEQVITEKKQLLNRIENVPRRKCTISDPFKGSRHVLGKVAHLALIKDDDVANVISWHLLGDMDCVVTETISAAKKIYDDTQGRQQVLPLETVFCRANYRPLPHIRNGEPFFIPAGNPVFAKDLLIFPEHAESCKKVFTALLGDTMIINDLDSANDYRGKVVQSQVQCPTLLTREGDRIRSNGKFGGLQNKAPPVEKLRGQVFGAPLPTEYHHMCCQIELLQRYSTAMQKASAVQSEYNSHIEETESLHMKQKKEELQKQEEEMRDLEKTLARTPEQMSSAVRVKRGLEPETPGPSLPPKRIRRKTKQIDV